MNVHCTDVVKLIVGCDGNKKYLPALNTVKIQFKY